MATNGGKSLAEVIQTDLAPVAAIAMLNAAKNAKASEQSNVPLKCLAAGLVESGNPNSVWIQFLFDGGHLLPVELTKEAAFHLKRALQEIYQPNHHTESSSAVPAFRHL
ncbi:MAG: hypothetical protein ACKVIH_09765 [Burkholderiales bacterium]